MQSYPTQTQLIIVLGKTFHTRHKALFRQAVQLAANVITAGLIKPTDDALHSEVHTKRTQDTLELGRLMATLLRDHALVLTPVDSIYADSIRTKIQLAPISLAVGDSDIEHVQLLGTGFGINDATRLVVKLARSDIVTGNIINLCLETRSYFVREDDEAHYAATGEVPFHGPDIKY